MQTVSRSSGSLEKKSDRCAKQFRDESFAMPQCVSILWQRFLFKNCVGGIVTFTHALVEVTSERRIQTIV